MSKIFISYRRSDSQDMTNRIYDRLRAVFGAEHIFKDVDSLRGGVDFRTAIGQALDQSEVLLVVIGPTWVQATDQIGVLRLNDPRDFVRQEIEGALSRGTVCILPVLVNGAKMPGEAQLPSSLAQLAYQHARPVDSGINFHHDMERVIKDISAFVPPQPPPGQEKETKKGKKPEPAAGAAPVDIGGEWVSEGDYKVRLFLSQHTVRTPHQEPITRKIYYTDYITISGAGEHWLCGSVAIQGTVTDTAVTLTLTPAGKSVISHVALNLTLLPSGKMKGHEVGYEFKPIRGKFTNETSVKGTMNVSFFRPDQ